MTKIRPSSYRNVHLREVVNGEDDILFNLFAVSHANLLDAISGLDDSQRENLMRLQFEAQHKQYRNLYPDIRQELIIMQGDVIGQIQVAVLDDELHLVDLSLLPDFRNRGIGSALLRDLFDEAADVNRHIVLHVSQGNPAASLYERLGFRYMGEQGIFWRMERAPTDSTDTASTG